ncbi:MAG: hypothetical protein Q7S02_03830, partial [bacterium]|nr:hypothetical protein [bacterium]
HGPTDEMRINRDHVLFIEQLRSDATVVRAIDAARERAAQPKPSAPSEPAPAPEEPAPAPAE